MIQNAAILFFSAILGGFIAIKAIERITSNVKLLLVFAGSFLFSVTVIHILPELFETEIEGFKLGLFILGGFFFQLFLEYFSDGVEHGHLHAHTHENSHSNLRSIGLMISLGVHSFLEGTLLAHPDSIHSGHSEGTLLLGIVLHKIPAGMALLSVLACYIESTKKQVFLLILFALASPLGVFSGHLLEESGLVDSNGMVFLFAFVAGNFLHISTTIFIESNPGHRWNAKKIGIGLLGAGVAVLAEWIA